MKKLIVSTVLAVLAALAPAAAAHQDVITVDVPGCRYGEERTDGKRACVIPFVHIATEGAPIALPTFALDGRAIMDTPLGLRVTPQGEFQMAGQSHNGLGNWLYRGGLWSIVSGTSHGVNAVIFNDAGVLTQGALRFGSQGLRFWSAPPLAVCTGNEDHTLCTGDNTYADPSRVLGEWTQLGDVAAGQSGFSCIAIYQGVRRVLHQGTCEELHMTRTGETLAISYYMRDLNTRRFRRLPAAALTTFPVQNLAPPVDPVDPDPVDPDPVDPPAQFNYDLGPLNTYAQQRWAELPHANRHEQATAFYRILYEWRQKGHPEIEAYRKGAGEGITLSDGFHYSEDILVVSLPNGKWWADVGAGFGCTVDLGCEASLQFTRDYKVTTEPEKCFPVPPPADGGPVDPPPPTSDVEKLKARILELETEATSLRRTIEDLNGNVADLQQARNDLDKEIVRLKDELAKPRPLGKTCEDRGAFITGPGIIRSLFGIRCEAR